MQGLATAEVSREEKHMTILGKLNQVLMSVESLEGLAQRIDPTPEKIRDGAQPPIPSTSLATFLNQMPQDLMMISDRINKAIEKIKAGVL